MPFIPTYFTFEVYDQDAITGVGSLGRLERSVIWSRLRLINQLISYLVPLFSDISQCLVLIVLRWFEVEMEFGLT